MEDKSRLEQISRILTELLKVIKIVSVYPESNPLPAKIKESFADRFIDLIGEIGTLSFRIGQNKIYHGEEVVYSDSTDDEALAFLFYRAGITEISFNADFDLDTCHQFFKIMKAFFNREEGSDDLVTLFWQADLPGFSYATLEDVYLDEYDGDFAVRVSEEEKDSFFMGSSSRFSESSRIQYASIFLEDDDSSSGSVAGEAQKLAEDKMGLAPAPAEKRSLPDTATILNEAFSLSEGELAGIEEIIKEDAQFDMFDSTCRLLKEMLYSQTEYQEFIELVTITEKLQTEFLRNGNLKGASDLLNNLMEINRHLDDSRSRWKERIHDALVVAGGRERLSTLVLALNSNSEISPDDLMNYLSVFGWEVLSVVIDILGELEFRSHREALCDYLVEAGREYVDIISKGIFDRRWFVVRNSVSVLARIGGEKAFSYLEKALGHEDSRVRRQIVKGLESNRDDKSIEIFKRLVWDDDEIVQQTAIETVLNLADERGFKIVAEMINDNRFASLSRPNQEGFIIMFSRLGGEHAVEYLKKLISDWGFFQTRAQEFYQQLAFKALSQNSSEKAERALLRLAKSWRKKIRRMANAALTARREVVFGD